MEKATKAGKGAVGPVEMVSAHLARSIDRIKTGKITRMDVIHAMEAKGVKRSTAAGTIAKWMRANSMEWAARSTPGRKPVTKSAPRKAR